MLSKSSDEMDILLRSRANSTVVTAFGEVQTNEEAQGSVRHNANTRWNASFSIAS